MALLGFGKKKPKVDKKKERVFIKLNHRVYPRYIAEGLSSSVGEVIDLSKISVQVSVKGLEEGDVINVLIDNRAFEAEVVRVFGNRAVLKFFEPLPKEVVEKYSAHIVTDEIEPKRQIAIEQLANQEEIDRMRAIINLMLELEDPNTNISKFKENIEMIEELEEKILLMANSVEIAGRGVVKDVAGAITRLGFEKVKSIVYRYVTYDFPLSRHELQRFENFEFFNLFFSNIFKKLAPLFNFNDIKQEGRSLLAMSSIGAFVLARNSDFLQERYEGPNDLFSFEARCTEYRECGYDLLEVNAIYLLKILKVFHYLYDGLVLAHYMLYPHYAPKSLKIELSQRKLRYAYVVYVSMLAQRYTLNNDRRSGYIFFERMKRFGFDEAEARHWLVQQMEEVKKKIGQIGLETNIKPPATPHSGIKVDMLLGTNNYSKEFLDFVEKFDKEGERFAVRYEDSGFFHLVLETILNSEKFNFIDQPFCVIPCDILKDEELPLAMFEGFDLVIFKDIHKLPEELLSDFRHIWKEFEGKILVTFDQKACLEYENIDLYELLRPFLVDFPSYYQSPVIHLKMIQRECKVLNEYLRMEMCDIKEFREEVIDLYGVVAKVLNKV